MARHIVSYDDLAPTPPPEHSPSISSNIQNNLDSNINTNRPVSNNPSADTTTLTTQPDFIGPIVPAHLQHQQQYATGTEGGQPSKKRKMMTSSPAGRGGYHNQNHNRNNNNQQQRYSQNGGGGGKGKGKWKNNKRNGAEAFSGGSRSASNLQHWDEPDLEISEIGYEEGNSMSAAQADDSMREVEMELSEGVADEEEDEEEEEESRDLTHDEVWDDSALIAAWDAANEEYEAMHGKNKDWKKELVHKSPLWYNNPPDKTKAAKGKGKASKAATGDKNAAQNAPSFAVPQEPPRIPADAERTIADTTSYYAGTMQDGTSFGADGVEGSVDEAFSRALGAMYWTGYWTAMYHARQRAAVTKDVSAIANAVEEEEAEEERLDHELTEALISTQR